MKYLIQTNDGDYISTKNRNAKTWLKELHQQNPKITSVWVYDPTGWWTSCAKIENKKAVDDFYCPDGELRVWVIWACRMFGNNSYCEDYEMAYYLVHQLSRVQDEEAPKQNGYIHDYKAFVKEAKNQGCYTFEK